MNPDNPNFRTPEEEARAQEFAKLKTENETLKQMWERATKFVMPGEFDTAESIKHYIDTLESENERLKRVVDVLKIQRCRLLSEKFAGFPLNAMNTESELDAEIEVIGKGEP